MIIFYLYLLITLLSIVYCENKDVKNENDNNNEDINKNNCIKAKVSDHVMIEYQILLKDGSKVMARQKPDQYFHFIIEESVSFLNYIYTYKCYNNIH